MATKTPLIRADRHQRRRARLKSWFRARRARRWCGFACRAGNDPPAGNRSARGSSSCSRSVCGSGRLLHAAIHPRRPRAAAAYAAGLRGAALEQAILSLRRQGLAGWGPRPATAAAESARHGRNTDWRHVFCRDVLSMPDKWEYPWFAAWDLAFHMVPLAHVDPQFAKEQLLLLLREWYMHPNGQLPAYEFAFGDVNPPVHAWACWRVYKITGARAGRPRPALSGAGVPEAADQLHLVGEPQGRGGAATSSPADSSGWTTSGIFDRSKPLPGGGQLEQADGTAWMAFYCAHHALDGPGAGRPMTRLRGHRVQILRAFRRHHRRHEHAGRDRAVGRRGWVLLRPAPDATGHGAAARAVGCRDHSAVRLEVLESDLIERFPASASA